MHGADDDHNCVGRTRLTVPRLQSEHTTRPHCLQWCRLLPPNIAEPKMTSQDCMLHTSAWLSGCHSFLGHALLPPTARFGLIGYGAALSRSTISGLPALGDDLGDPTNADASTVAAASKLSTAPCRSA